MNETVVTREGTTLTIERIINAPKDKVWEAYANPDIFAKWFSTEGWTTRIKHFDFNAGGYTLFAMKCDDTSSEMYGQESWSKSEYSIVTPKESFAYKDSFSNEEGVSSNDMPTTDVIVTLEELNGSTKIVSRSTYVSEENLEQVLAMGMEEGIKQTFDKLASTIE